MIPIEAIIYKLRINNSDIIFVSGSWKIDIFLNVVSARTNGVYWIILPSALGIASTDIIMLEDIRKIIPVQTEAITPVSSELKICPMIIPAKIKKELISVINKNVKINGR